jgi:hypothetical protein
MPPTSGQCLGNFYLGGMLGRHLDMRFVASDDRNIYLTGMNARFVSDEKALMDCTARFVGFLFLAVRA